MNIDSDPDRHWSMNPNVASAPCPLDSIPHSNEGHLGDGHTAFPRQKSDPRSEVSRDSGLAKSPRLKEESCDSDETERSEWKNAPLLLDERSKLTRFFADIDKKDSLAAQRFCYSMIEPSNIYARPRRSRSLPVLHPYQENGVLGREFSKDLSFDDCYIDKPFKREQTKLNHSNHCSLNKSKNEGNVSLENSEKSKLGRRKLPEIFTFEVPGKEQVPQAPEKCRVDQSCSAHKQPLEPASDILSFASSTSGLSNESDICSNVDDFPYDVSELRSSLFHLYPTDVYKQLLGQVTRELKKLKRDNKELKDRLNHEERKCIGIQRKLEMEQRKAEESSKQLMTTTQLLQGKQRAVIKLSDSNNYLKRIYEECKHENDTLRTTLNELETRLNRTRNEDRIKQGKIRVLEARLQGTVAQLFSTEGLYESINSTLRQEREAWNREAEDLRLKIDVQKEEKQRLEYELRIEKRWGHPSNVLSEGPNISPAVPNNHRNLAAAARGPSLPVVAQLTPKCSAFPPNRNV